MGCTMTRIPALVGSGCVGLALLLQIIGMATLGWSKITEEYELFGNRKKDTIWRGLWHICSNDSCSHITAYAAWLEVCKAFSILGILAMAASLAFALLTLFLSEGKRQFSLAALVSAVAGAVCSLVEFAVFAGKRPDTAKSSAFLFGQSEFHESLGYSFVLTVLACVLCVIAAVLFFLAKRGIQ